MPKQNLPFKTRVSIGPNPDRSSLTNVTVEVAAAMDRHGVTTIRLVMDLVMLEDIEDNLRTAMDDTVWELEQRSGDEGFEWRSRVAPHLADLAVADRHIRKACLEEELLYESDQQGAILFGPLVMANQWFGKTGFWKEDEDGLFLPSRKWAGSDKTPGLQADFELRIRERIMNMSAMQTRSRVR